MKNNKYKIMVLSDLKDTSGSTLKSTVSLAKMIGGTIEFFHVKKPTEIVPIDNQLSAMRTINENQLKTEKKIEKIIKPIREEYDVDINYKFSFGNVKAEIGKYIEESQPDIIVLGKRKPKMMKLIGDSITNFVLNNYDGVVMIAADTNVLEPNKELYLGILNGIEQKFNIDFAEDLMGHTQKPLKSFKIVKNSNERETTASVSNKSMVEYVFDQGDNAIQNLSKYLSISNVNLLFVDRSNSNTDTDTSILDSDIQNVMDSLNVSLLLGRGKIALK
ncbi:MAG: universal stress protein [Aquaticitalea sp.]